MHEDEFRYVDNQEPISREDIAGMTVASLIDVIGKEAVAAMSDDELESHTDDAIASRLAHGLIEPVPEDY